MIVYRDYRNNGYIDAAFERYPCGFIFSINDVKYRYDMYGKPIDAEDPFFDAKVKEWIDMNWEWVKKIVREWNMTLNIESIPPMDLSMLVE